MNLRNDLLEFTGNYFQTTKETISVAESVTAGFLQFSFSQIKDASTFFKGGITAYTLEEKVRFLKVDRKEAEENDCVSQNIADTMALNVTDLFHTDWGIAITGLQLQWKNQNTGFLLISVLSIKIKQSFPTK